MKKTITALIGAAFLVSAAATADLTPWEDYDVGESVWTITTIKVDSNMGDAYLEGIRDTWVKGQEIAKELGHIEDYYIYRSELPESGDFNLMLVVHFADDSKLAPNKARYDEFMAEWGMENAEAATERAQQNYPAMREIVGEYRFRQITLK